MRPAWPRAACTLNSRNKGFLSPWPYCPSATCRLEDRQRLPLLLPKTRDRRGRRSLIA
jgi:hypothetical protein